MRHTIFLLTLLLAAPAARAQIPEPVPFEADDFAGLHGELELLARRGEFWGVVLLARGSDVLMHEAYGLADRSRDVANTPRTAFAIASVGKQFTAALTLALAQEGALGLDDPVADYVSGLSPMEGEPLTVRHLLRMESGWSDYLEHPDYTADPKRFREVSDYVELIRKLEPEFAPGEDRVYSNVSYELLGAVVEAAGGSTYAEALQRRILDRAGMYDSGCFRHRAAPGRAVPYSEEDGRLVDAYPLLAFRCSPAGGAYATALDLLRFQRAVLDGGLLDAKHRRLFVNGFDQEGDGAERFGFIGGAEGMNAWMETSLETDVTAIVLANLDPPAAERVMLGLLEWLETRPATPRR